MNGIDVLRAIRDALPRTAVLMVTASADLGTVQSAIASGASGFIVKPFNTVTVHDTMHKTALAVLRQRAQGTQ
jgi:two-component system chemotaxis response regulator CheY